MKRFLGVCTVLLAVSSQGQNILGKHPADKVLVPFFGQNTNANSTVLGINQFATIPLTNSALALRSADSPFIYWITNNAGVFELHSSYDGKLLLSVNSIGDVSLGSLILEAGGPNSFLNVNQFGGAGPYAFLAGSGISLTRDDIQKTFTIASTGGPQAITNTQSDVFLSGSFHGNFVGQEGPYSFIGNGNGLTNLNLSDIPGPTRIGSYLFFPTVSGSIYFGSDPNNAQTGTRWLNLDGTRLQAYSYDINGGFRTLWEAVLENPGTGEGDYTFQIDAPLRVQQDAALHGNIFLDSEKVLSWGDWQIYDHVVPSEQGGGEKLMFVGEGAGQTQYVFDWDDAGSSGFHAPRLYAGRLQLSFGAHSGYVLTSDGVGNGSWQPIAVSFPEALTNSDTRALSLGSDLSVAGDLTVGGNINNTSLSASLAAKLTASSVGTAAYSNTAAFVISPTNSPGDGQFVVRTGDKNKWVNLGAAAYSNSAAFVLAPTTTPTITANAGAIQYALVTGNNTPIWSPVSKWGSRKIMVAEYQNNPSSGSGYSLGWTIAFAGSTIRNDASSSASPYQLLYTPTLVNSFSAVDDASAIPSVPSSKNSYFEFHTGLTNTSNVRVWVGLASTSAANYYSTQSPTTRHLAIFRYSTNSPNWFFITGDGSALTTTDTGIAASTSDITLAVIINGGTSAVGCINGSPVATNTTHLPSSALEPSMSQNNLEAANKGLRFYSIYGEQDW